MISLMFFNMLSILNKIRPLKIRRRNCSDSTSNPQSILESNIAGFALIGCVLGHLYWIFDETPFKNSHTTLINYISICTIFTFTGAGCGYGLTLFPISTSVAMFSVAVICYIAIHYKT